MKLLVAWAILEALGVAFADPLPGATLPPAQLVDKDSRPAVWKTGRVAILSFFAFWCDTWKNQSPRLIEARAALQGLPIDLETISIDGRWTDVPGYNPTLPLLLDRRGWSAGIGVDRVPTTVVVDQNGVVRWVRSGVVRTEELIAEARAALSPREEGRVILRIDEFPPSKGAFALIDELRRLDAHAQIGLKAGTASNDPLVRKALAEGISIAGELPKHALVDPYDETRPGVEEIVRRTVLAAAPGVTILLHADVRETREALPRIVAALRRRGLRV